MDWTALSKAADAARERSILGLFASDPRRAAEFSVEAGGLFFDYSKSQMNAEDRDLLVSLYETAGVPARREAMFAGEKINETEGRAVLHTALRAGDDAVIPVDGADVMPGVRKTRDAMLAFAEDVRSGAYAPGGRITDVVNIGIGGSDLGPVMAVEALKPYGDGPRCHFVSEASTARACERHASAASTRAPHPRHRPSKTLHPPYETR